MSAGLRVEVSVRGHLAGDLIAMVESLEPRVVPRHTVITLARGDGRNLVSVLHALERAGVEVERVTT